MSVPNQKKIIVERVSTNASKDYLKVSEENLYLAMYNLKPTTFLLWIYFTDNKQGYAFDLYPVDFINKSGVSRSTYDRAFDELEEKGYLIKSDSVKNLYIFKEKSKSDKIRKVDEVWTLDEESLESIKRKYFSQID